MVRLWIRDLWTGVAEVVGGAAIGFTLIDVVGQPVRVDGHSMQPTLNPDKSRDWVFLNRWIRRDGHVERGEIVAFKSPHNCNQMLIKRVVGVEGQLIRTRNYSKKFVQIPEAHCWVEGDSQREDCLDSNVFGPVSLGLITAKATRIVWPPSRWGKLDLDFSGRVPVTQEPAAWNIFDDDDL